MNFMFVSKAFAGAVKKLSFSNEARALVIAFAVMNKLRKKTFLSGNLLAWILLIVYVLELV